MASIRKLARVPLDPMRVVAWSGGLYQLGGRQRALGQQRRQVPADRRAGLERGEIFEDPIHAAGGQQPAHSGFSADTGPTNGL